MTLRLFYHPISSFCWKVLIALYESGTPFEADVVNLGDPDDRARLQAISPTVKFPAVLDGDLALFEASIIVEHVAPQLIPPEREAAREARLLDRVFDLYVQAPMQRIVADRLRPADRKNAEGVEQARQELRTIYAFLDRRLARRTWATGEAFTLADCAAAPALYYAHRVEPIGEGLSTLAAYRERLLARPSMVRTLEQAQPLMHLFPEA